MSLTFTIPTGFLRPFFSMLTCACKIGDAIFFVPYDNILELRCLHPNHSAHLLMSVDTRHLEGYRYQPSASVDAGGGGEHKASEDLSICILSQTLQCTVLHQSYTALRSVHVSFGNNSINPRRNHCENPPGEQHSTAGAAPDRLRFDCFLSKGIVTSYHLHLCEGTLTRVATDPKRYHFGLRGDAKVMGGLLSFLPTTAPRCMIVPLEGRLELRWVEEGDHDSSGSGRRPSAVSVGDGLLGGEGNATSVVSAYPPNFTAFRYYTTVTDTETANVDGYDRTPDQPLGPVVGHATSLKAVAHYPLPSKVVDVKPFKRISMLSGQLGLPVEMEVGDEGCPVILRVMDPAVGQLLGHRSFGNLAAATHPEGRRLDAVAASSLAPSSLSPHSEGLAIACTLHLAVVDGHVQESGSARTTIHAAPPHTLPGRPTASSSTAAVPQSLVDTTNASSSAVLTRTLPTIPASGVHTASSLPTNNRSSSGLQQPSIAMHPTMETTPVSTVATLSVVPASEPSQTTAAVVLSSSTVGTRGGDPTGPPSLTRTRIDASYATGCSDDLSSQMVPPTTASSPPTSHPHGISYPSLTRSSGDEAANSLARRHDDPVRHTLMEQPTIPSIHVPASQSQSAHHSTAAFISIPPSGTRGGMSHPAGRLSELYSLDYEAFAASHAKEVDDVADGDDEELQRFLQSCAALLMTNGGLDTHTAPSA